MAVHRQCDRGSRGLSRQQQGDGGQGAGCIAKTTIFGLTNPGKTIVTAACTNEPIGAINRFDAKAVAAAAKAEK